MSLSLGSTTIGSLYLGSTKVGAAYLGNVKVWEAGVPAKTLRFQFANTSFNPITETYSANGLTCWRWTKVADGVYDFHCDFDYWTLNPNNTFTPSANTILNDVRTANYPYPFNNYEAGAWIDIIDSNLTGVYSITKVFHPMRKVIRNVVLKNTDDLTDCYNWGNSGGMSILASLSTGSLANSTNFTNFLAGVSASRDFTTVEFGDFGAVSLSSLFSNLKYLTSVTLGDTSHVTSMSSMFSGCAALPSVSIDATSATNVNSMFKGCRNLTSATVTNTSSATNMSNMFSGCTSLTTAPTLSTSIATNMSSMFSGCTSLTSVPQYNTSSVTDMSNMFRDCTSLTSVPQYNTSSVTDMNHMFSGCTSLTSVPQYDTSSVTNMYYMFGGCASLTSVPQYDTSSVTSLSSMFYGCSSLTTAPTLSTSSATNMSNMFKGCTALTSVPLYNTSSATNVASMFESCVNVASGALALYNQMSTQATPPQSHSNAFKNCGSNTVTGQSDLEQIPFEWGGTLYPTNISIGSSWTLTKVSGNYVGWSLNTSNIDFSSLVSMGVNSNGTISQFEGISMNRSRVIPYGSLDTSSSVALYYWPVFYQKPSVNSAPTWILSQPTYHGYLPPGQGTDDMTGTLNYVVNGTHSVSTGTYNSGATVYFGFIVTNTSTMSSDILTNVGYLYSQYLNSSPDLYTPSATVNPQSAIIGV